MKEIMLVLWERHAERLMFMLLALLLSAGMYYIGWKDEAKVIIIGIAMLCFNKARAPDKPEVKNETSTV